MEHVKVNPRPIGDGNYVVSVKFGKIGVMDTVKIPGGLVLCGGGKLHAPHLEEIDGVLDAPRHLVDFPKLHTVTIWSEGNWLGYDVWWFGGEDHGAAFYGVFDLEKPYETLPCGARRRGYISPVFKQGELVGDRWLLTRYTSGKTEKSKC